MSNNQLNQSNQKPSYTSEQKHITTKLAQWITVDLQPFSVIEQAEFRDFIYTLNSRYVIPCRQNIKQEVELLFLQRRTNFKSEINNIMSKFSLTTNIWTSSYNHTAFLGITMHYINNNWEVNRLTKTLFTDPFVQKKKSKNIFQQKIRFDITCTK